MALALFFASQNVEPAKALVYSPARAVFRPRVEAPPATVVPAQQPPVVNLSSLTGVFVESPQYRSVPPEDLNPISWTNPPRLLYWQMRRITQWDYYIHAALDRNDYHAEINAMLIRGMIAQESQGDNNAVCNDFDTARGTCAVGLMALTPGHCGLTESQLRQPAKNIDCGARIINQVYEQALEHGFRPGREATSAALASFNCGWPSLLADRCFSFGGWNYAWKGLNYWQPLLEKYLEEHDGS